jgi:hypothetical protein
MEPRKHSGVGIASFILSVMSAVFIFITLVVAGVMEATTPGGMDEGAPGTIVVGLMMITFFFVAMVGLGLGVGGLCQKNRKKIFAILGTIFSTVTILCTVFVVILGLSMQ